MGDAWFSDAVWVALFLVTGFTVIGAWVWHGLTDYRRGHAAVKVMYSALAVMVVALVVLVV